MQLWLGATQQMSFEELPHKDSIDMDLENL